MANVFEIADKLRKGEEVIIHNKYQFVLMQEFENHRICDISINFHPHDKNHAKLTLVK